MPAVIKAITIGSPVYGSAVKPGDKLIAINGHVIKDVLDYKFHAYDSKVTVQTISPKGKIHLARVRKAEGQDLGLEFETYLMDKARACSNKCIFCFIDQMPKGMRKTLYFKDDDARLSFLLGNYITLTNLSENDVERIIKMHVSPVNVSVQTTNPELRCFMLGNKKAGECLSIMQRFANAGITMNCQIVCCPGINDGAELERSMKDLKAMYPAVHSVSIVPVGLTKFRENLQKLKPFDKKSASETIDLVESFADKCYDEFGTRIFFCSDELYLTAERPLPPEGYYEEYAQIENGVGMLRSVQTEFEEELELLDEPREEAFSIASGESAAPFLKRLSELVSQKGKINCNVYAIKNDFFGHSINVSGLITGGDLINQLKGKELGERLFIPCNMLRKEEQDFLDDVTLEEASKALGVPIIPIAEDGGELARAMFGLLPGKTKEIVETKTQDEFYRYNPSER